MQIDATTNWAELWEQFKIEVKMSAIERACVMRHKAKQREKELQSMLDYFLNAECTIPGLFSKQIREIKRELERVDAQIYQGAAIRARSERLWLGEAPTKRALSDEKGYASKT